MLTVYFIIMLFIRYHEIKFFLRVPDMTGFYRLADGTKSDELIHSEILNEAEKHWEGSQAQKDSIARHIEFTGAAYEDAKKLYTHYNNKK